MDVKGNDGKVVTWMIEGGSPNNLYRLGFTKDSPAAWLRDLGRRLPGQGPLHSCSRARALRFSDGRKLFLGLHTRESDPETKK